MINKIIYIFIALFVISCNRMKVNENGNLKNLMIKNFEHEVIVHVLYRESFLYGLDVFNKAIDKEKGLSGVYDFLRLSLDEKSKLKEEGIIYRELLEDINVSEKDYNNQEDKLSIDSILELFDMFIQINSIKSKTCPISDEKDEIFLASTVIYKSIILNESEGQFKAGDVFNSDAIYYLSVDLESNGYLELLRKDIVSSVENEDLIMVVELSLY